MRQNTFFLLICSMCASVMAGCGYKNIGMNTVDAENISNIAGEPNSCIDDVFSTFTVKTSDYATMSHLLDESDTLSLVKINTIAGITTARKEQVPQTGTWQLKETTNKKYITISTDDDNSGNANFFRLLRTYGFPYTMNIEAENLNKSLGSDITQPFSDTEAEALFPNGVTVAELSRYLHDSGLGEVTQHGSSANALWDSSKLTGDFWTSLYTSYRSEGGTKTEAELKRTIIEQKASTDGMQNATYIDNSKKMIEDTLGFPVYSIAMWGGAPKAVVDGIEISLNKIKGTPNYDYRKHNYKYVASHVGNKYKETKDIYTKYRNYYTVDIQPYIDAIAVGDIEDFYCHMPYHDIGNEGLRQMLNTIKANVNAGTLEVVTPSQYIALGEYVDNPITSITVSRDVILAGHADRKEDYTVTAFYADGTSSDVSSEAIVNNSNINTNAEGTYIVSAIYRGFNALLEVTVIK